MLRAHLPCHASSSGRCHVYVYRGEGAGWRSVRSAFESLQRLLPEQYEVSTLTAAELVEGSWTAAAALLVMPGGADLPYCNRLNGKGNSIIQGFVRAGGSYLGLCAGAYYASSRVQFEQGSRLQVVGDRELAFFPGIACGAAYPGFDYQTEAGAVAADVQFAVPPALAQQLQQQQGSTLLQENCSSSWCFTHDYSNGGPVFVTHDMQLDVSSLPGVQVLATYSALPDRHGLNLSRQQQQHKDQQHLQQQPGMLHNGVAGVQPAAAVRCSVGAGVAVLCGTHPELEPQWLDVCGWSTERPRAGSHQTAAAEGAVAASAGGRGSTAAAAAAAGAGGSGRSARPAVAVLEGAVASGQRPPRAMQQQQDQRNAAAVVPASSRASGVEAGQLNVCEDVQLEQHTEALRRVLAPSQEQRDLFLSCLLYEVLRRA